MAEPGKVLSRGTDSRPPQKVGPRIAYGGSRRIAAGGSTKSSLLSAARCGGWGVNGAQSEALLGRDALGEGKSTPLRYLNLFGANPRRLTALASAAGGGGFAISGQSSRVGKILKNSPLTGVSCEMVR